MIIERYSEQHRWEIEYIIQCFQDESLAEYGIKIDPDVLSKTIADVREYSFMLMIDDVCVGILAGKPVMTPCSDQMIWQELVWFVLEEHRSMGVLFLNEVRRILKLEGYDAMSMVCMENSKKDKLYKLYERLGFKPMEHHFMGSLDENDYQSETE